MNDARVTALYLPSIRERERPILLRLGSIGNASRRLSIADAERLAALLAEAVADARANIYPPPRDLEPVPCVSPECDSVT